jgi:chemotaxis protein methyltransferase CheR
MPKKITSDEIDLLAKYILTVSGIKLDQSKGYLIENRLGHFLSANGCSSFTDLYYKAKSDSSNHLQQEIVDAITTNETFFFRDNTPFDLLKNKIIPDLIDRRMSQNSNGAIPLKVWSAACSTGQEVYSIAITLMEMLPDRKKYDISIYGTDISDKAVAQASYGKYTQFEVERGLSVNKRQKYFVRSGSDWRIKDEVRSLAKFEKINLMKPFTGMAKFDVVFCRNVAIYFNSADKIRLFRKIAGVMQHDGALIVGGSENLSGSAPDLRSQQYLKGIFYELKTYTGQNSSRKSVESVPPRVKKIAAKTVRRKTVYDRPRKKEGSAKESSSELTASQTKKRGVSAEHIKEADTATDQAVSLAVDQSTNPPAESGQAVSLAEKLSAQKEESQKSSLLSGIQNKKQGSSLLDAKQGGTGTSSGSLLDKINRRNIDD